MENLLTVRDIAARLALSTEHTRVLCRQGKLPVFKFGNRDWRIEESDLHAFIQSLKLSETAGK